jgi:hypothetical protein
MDNYVLEKNLFKLLKDSIRPSDFINCNLPTITSNRSSTTEKIVKLFMEMKYYE